VKYLSAALAIMAAALLAATGAVAAPPPGQHATVVEVRDVTQDGQPLTPWRVVATEDEQGENQQRARTPARVGSTSGCRETNVTRNDYDFIGHLNWSWRAWTRWCWSYPHVTGVWRAWYPQVNSTAWQYDGRNGSGYAYTWCCGVWNSGYTRYDQAHFSEWLPLKSVKISDVYPWIQQWNHANGAGCFQTDKSGGVKRCWAAP
jgi:hypothetical protein